MHFRARPRPYVHHRTKRAPPECKQHFLLRQVHFVGRGARAGLGAYLTNALRAQARAQKVCDGVAAQRAFGAATL